MEFLPDSITQWIDQLEGSSNYLLAAAAVVAFLAFYGLGYLLKRLLNRLLPHARQNSNQWDEVVIESTIPPLRHAVRLTGLIISLKIMGFIAYASIIERVLYFSSTAYILLITWALLRLIGIGESQIITSNDKLSSDTKRDVTTIAAVAKLLKVVVFVVLILLLLQQYGVDITGLIAAGGIGGLAIGFAAKDLLANFFGGILLYTERPFKVGDWIRAPSHGVEGTVEDIGMRMTRLRTFDQRPLYVPNSIFTSIPVENASRMFNRRINISVGVRYQDAHVVRTIVTEVRETLMAMEDIDTSRTIIVNFNAFAPSSLDFMVYCFTRATDFIEFHTIKEKVLFMIMDIIDRHHASIAYPTSTIQLVKENDNDLQ